MKNCSKKLCLLAILVMLGTGNFVNAQDLSDLDAVSDQNIVSEKIKANRDTLAKAQDAIDKKDFNTAINYLTGYINSKSSKYEVYKLRGDAYYALRRYDLAQKDYQSAIDLKASGDKISTGTKYVGAIILGADKNEQLQNTELGNLYASLMYAQKALNNPAYTLSYDNAVKYNSHIYLPSQNKSDINKINCPQKYGRPLTPSGIDETIYSAISDIEKEDFHSAIFKIQNVINDYPNYYLGYYLMGVALGGEEKEDEAISAFNKAISLNPYDFESYASLGQIYFDKAETNFSDIDMQKSVGYFDKAINLNKNCPTYYFYKGLNNLNAGNYADAISEFNKSLQINEKDYNSMYYKLIVQYITGDYNSVIDGANKLIYKHVSNSNSVHYLRALAYYKLGNNEKALEDLSSIENSISDIFNSDIKKNSKKDDILISYVNYLRNKIEKGSGFSGVTNNGNSNPIINRLANAERSLSQYKDILNSKNITPEDCEKLNNFYSTSLPKMLSTNAFITYDDIDTQYDYIRTTFSDLGITFIQKAPDNYVMTTIKDYATKRYMNTQNQHPNELLDYPDNDIQNIELQKDDNITNQFNQSYNTMLQPGESSLAQMLASNMLINRPLVARPVSSGYVGSQNSADISNSAFKPEIPDGEFANSAPIATSEEPYLQTDKQLVSDSNLKKVKEFIQEEKSLPSDNRSDSLLFKAEEIKDSPSFSIKNKPIYEENDTNKDANIKISAKEFKSGSDVKIYNEPVEYEIPSVLDVSDKINQSEKNFSQPVAEGEKKIKTAASNPYISTPVYKGLSQDAKMPEINDWSDAVELDLGYGYSNSNNLFHADRLGFGIGANSSNSIFNGNTKSATQKNDVANEESIYTPISVEDNNNDVQSQITVPEITLPGENIAIIQNNISDIAPQYQADENAPQLRLASSSVQPVENKTVSYDDIATNVTHTKDGYTLLDEYDRLLKEQKKQAKIKAKQEKQLAKAAAKEQKAKAKEEIKALKAEQKIKSAQEKLEQEKNKIRLSEEQAAAKLEAEKLKEEAKALAEKQKLKQEENKDVQTSALKARVEEQKLLNEQLKQERAKAKAEQKAKKAEEKAKQKAAKLAQKEQNEKQETSSDKISFSSKLKNIFKSKKSSTVASNEEKLQEKVKQEQLKQERAKAKAEQKAKKAEEKAKQKALKLAQKEQAAKEKIANNTSAKTRHVLKSQTQRSATAEEDKLKEKVKQEQLKQERAKAKAEQKARKAEEKAKQKALKLAQAENKKKAEQKVSNKSENESSLFSKLKFWQKKEEKPSLRL